MGRPLFKALATMLLLTWAACAAYAAEAPRSGLDLYRQLRDSQLDGGRVYRVHDLAIDRAEIHITLNSGTIAFSRTIEGRVTGAFFEGDGEILLLPPNPVERASMALFTHAAILEESFSSAFLRFSDDAFEQVRPSLFAAEDAPEFISRWDPMFRKLCSSDAFELLRFLTWSSAPEAAPGPYLHVRIASRHLGAFDVIFDSQYGEQVSVGQMNYVNGAQMFDVWTSFSSSGSRLKQSASSDLNELGREDFRITSYNIRTHILPSHELEADAQLDLEVTHGGARTIIFELSRNLKVSSVTANGLPAEFVQNESLEGSELARRGNDLIAVVLPDWLRTGEKKRLRFHYSGSVLTEAGSGLLYVGARGIWYPNRGPAPSNFDLEFRSPPGWTLIATGKRAAAESSAGEEVSRWVSERPIPMAGFNLGKYVSAQVKTGDTLVETFASHGVEASFKQPPPDPLEELNRRRTNTMPPPPLPPPAPSTQAEAVAKRSAQAVEFLSRHFGPFPYSSLAITQMPGPVSEGWPGLIFLSSYAFLTSAERQRLQLGPYEDLLYGEIVPAHEAAHQWWGDAVLLRTYHDGWLAEALANYSALLVLEKDKPAVLRHALEHYRQDLARRPHEGAALKEAGPVTLGHRLNSSRLPDAYDLVCYGRGTWLIHMLREMFRDADRQTPDPDARFLHALRTLRERFDGDRMSTQDLQKALEDELPASLRYEGRRSLGWFFEGWVNGTAVPRFQASGVKFSHNAGKTVIRGMLLQKDAPNTLVTSVPLYAAAGKGSKPVYLGRVFADGPETEFHLSAPADAHSLLIDPYQTVLSQP